MRKNHFCVESLEARLCLSVPHVRVFSATTGPYLPNDPPFPPGGSAGTFDIFEEHSIPPQRVPAMPETWFSAGPSTINQGQTPGAQAVSGRVTGVAVDPSDSNVIYIATAGGGVWKTTNGGQTWLPRTDDQPINVVGSIAIAPSDRSILYAGTGEANNSADSSYGRGILKSTDSGSTWTLLETSVFNRLSVGRIAVDPTNPNVVYAAVSHSQRNGVAGGTGVYKSINGGMSWINTTSGITTADNWSDLQMHPTSPNILYAAVGNRTVTSAAGIFKTIDGGVTWLPAGNYPNGTTNGRIALGLSPSTPTTIYASAANPSTGGLLRMSKSIDSGATWTHFSTTPNYLGSYGWYDTSLIVDPTNPNIVYLGGASGTNSVLRSINGGTSWTSIAVGADGGGPHPHHHASAIDPQGRLLVGTEGGIWRLESPGPFRWSNINGNLQIANLTSVAIDPSSLNNIIVGSQNTGTLQTAGTATWTMREGGSGGDVAFSTTNPKVVYHIAPVASFGASNYFRRSDNGGVSWASKTTGLVNSDRAAFYPPFAVDPNNGARLVLGTNVVNQTTNGGDSWTAISPVLQTGATIDALTISESDPNTIYAAAGGHIFVTTNGGANWVERSAPQTDHIQELLIDPTDSLIAYAVRDRFSSGHVFRTTNGGLDWANISGNLPDLPANCLAMEGSGATATLYVGTDAGVFISSDLGGSWSRYGAGMPPNLWVRDITITSGNVLVAATYGRGVFVINSAGSQTGTINGIVFEDTNGNGEQDAGEPGLPGQTVFIDQNNNNVLDSATIVRTSTDVPRTIPDFPGPPATSVINVSGTSGIIQTVVVNLGITHTFDADLAAVLISPDGTRVPLFAQVGLGGDDFLNTTFDDQAATFIADGVAPFTGSFRPSGLLSNLKGESANGVWKLEITDAGINDFGALINWSLSIATGEPTETTQADGRHHASYDKLTLTTYQMGLVRPPGFRQTLPQMIFPDSGLHEVTIGPGQAIFDVDFGIVPDNVAPTVISSEFLFETSPHRVMQVFSEDVGYSLTTADFTLMNQSTRGVVPLALSYVGATATALVTPSGGPILPDGNYRLQTIAAGVFDNAGNPMSADHKLDFFVFAGDANRDRSIDISDFAIVAGRFNLPGTYSQGDFNYDGETNISDFATLASKFNRSLPVPGDLKKAPVNLARSPTAIAWAPRQFSSANDPADDRVADLLI